MTVMAPEDRQARPARTAIRRPASGFEIDPGRLIRWRAKRAWSRDDLAARILALHLTDEVTGRPYTVTRDAIAKIENGGRNPKPRTLRALCLGLSTEDEPCRPEDLLMPEEDPDRDWDDLDVTSGERRGRLAAGAGLQEFAEAHGIPYHRGGRVAYSRMLRDAYALAEAGASEEDVAEAVTAAINAAKVAEAVARITRGERRQPPAGLADSALIDVLDLSPPAHNALISAGVRTIGELTARGGKDLAAAGVPAKAVREIRTAVAGHGRALRDDAA